MLGAIGLLIAAITTEVAATAALPKANGFRDPMWTALVIGGYAVSIWMLALVVRHLPVSMTYAVWSGLGTAAIAVIGAMFLGESWDWIKVSALTLIVAGVIMLNMNCAH